MRETRDEQTLEALKQIPADQIAQALVFLSSRFVVEFHTDRQPGQSISVAHDELLTAHQVAQRLNVPECWVRSEQRARRLPALYLGKYVRFRWREVEAALMITQPERP